MGQKWTENVRAVFLLCIISLISACQVETPEDSCNGAHVVGIHAGGAQTRTEMLSDGLGTVWTDGDEIAVWAVDASGSEVLSNKKFITYGLDNSRGFFTSTLSSAMPDGTYTYFCSYPAPVSVNGTMATFSLPSVQDGKVSDGADIMIATPVQHGPLTAISDPDDHSGMSMQMNRMLHQFRFFIPENDEVLGNQKIKKIELTFPQAVCGAVTFDISDPSKAAVLTDSGSKITLDLARPFGRSSESTDEYDFACVSVAPFKAEQGQMLSIKAFTEDKIAKLEPIDMRARTFQAGHSTPVRFLIKELVDFPYLIRFTLNGNNVGENVTSIKFVAPSGCRWPASGTNEYVYQPGNEILAGEVIDFRFPEYEDYAKFSNAAITIELETENTISTSNVSIGSIPTGVESHTSQISATVPYLLYQDFSSIGSYNDGHDNPTVGVGSDTYTGITELTSIGLPGWYGTRIGIEGGKSARICCRYEHVLLAGAYYKGRIYAPQFSRIKDGHDVKINVSFNYGTNRKEKEELKWEGWKPVYTTPDKSPVLYMGINTQDVVTNPDVSEGDIVDSITGMISGSGFSSATASSLMPMVIKGEVLDKENGSYTNLPKTKSLTIDGVDNNMRLGWILSTDNSASNTNANYWFYIDNIKVQIVK